LKLSLKYNNLSVLQNFKEFVEETLKQYPDSYVGTNSLQVFFTYEDSRVNESFIKQQHDKGIPWELTIVSGNLRFVVTIDPKSNDFKKGLNNFSFERHVRSQLGNVSVPWDTTYSKLTACFEYPKELEEKLRPYPTGKELEFELESEAISEPKKFNEKSVDGNKPKV